MVEIQSGDLSPLIADFVDRFGLDDTLKIVEEYKNQILYIPYEGPTKIMIDRLGEDLCRRLGKEFSGCQWRIPKANQLYTKKRNALMRLRRSEGKRQSEIAAEFNLSYGQVGCILRQGTSVDLMSDRGDDIA